MGIIKQTWALRTAAHIGQPAFHSERRAGTTPTCMAAFRPGRCAAFLNSDADRGPAAMRFVGGEIPVYNRHRFGATRLRETEGHPGARAEWTWVISASAPVGSVFTFKCIHFNAVTSCKPEASTQQNGCVSDRSVLHPRAHELFYWS